jgi:hypothetical protein
MIVPEKKTCMVMSISRLMPKSNSVQNYFRGLPGGTLSGDPGWKNLVWWFF